MSQTGVLLNNVHALTVTISDVTVGLTPTEVQGLVNAAVAGAVGPLRDTIVNLSQRLGVTQGAILSMLRDLGEDDVPLELLPQKLAYVVEQYQQAMRRIAVLDPYDPITRDLAGRAQAAIKEGQFSEADGLLSEAEHVEIAAARQAQHLAQQAQTAADQRLLRAANTRWVRGNIAMTRLRYVDAAQHFQEAADLVPADYSVHKGGLLRAKADALQHLGDEHGNNTALISAIDTY